MTTPTILEEKITIQSYLTDNKMELTLPALFGLIQEISSKHVTQCGIGWENLKDKNLFWVLSKIKLSISRLPKWSETIILKTWGKLHDLVVEPRDYEMVDEQGNVLIKGTSSWVIIDSEKGKIQSLNKFEEHLIYPENKDAFIERAPKVAKIEIAEQEPSEHVRYSDLDMNQHVNNAKYIQWALDSISQVFRDKHNLKEAVVNYINQARYGDIYNVASVPIGINNYITTIFSANDKREFCRISSVWKKN